MAKQAFCQYGGHPVLDFVNTVACRLSATPTEKLQAYDDLVRFSRQVGVVDGTTAAALRGEAARSPAAAARALTRARRLRELIFRLCEVVRRRQDPARSDLDELNRRLAAAQRGAAVHWSGKTLCWAAPDLGLDLMLPLLIRAAAELLTSEQSRRIAQCRDADGCGWLFLDNSRSRARQWCSMADCGNRAKARRHYRRSR